MSIEDSRWEVEEEITEPYEYRAGGSQYHDEYSTAYRTIGYKWRKKITERAWDSYGNCMRLGNT